jgi:coenzyme F420-0:L-glutamate ligase / coenzyme F420-1:gamma-L-glutamate ligase
MIRELRLIALPGIPEVERGAELAPLLLASISSAGLSPEPDDIIVIAQKIISKSEGRGVRLDTVEPSPRALDLANVVGKDPRLIELVLRESTEVLRAKPGVLIVEHRLGFVMANAGVDQSNLASADTDAALLLPEDPDRSAQHLRDRLRERCGKDIGIVINDSFGRAWRHGVAGIAIGVAGVPALVDVRGERDRAGRPLRYTQIAAADELAAAASLLMGQAAESSPAVLVRGFPYAPREGSARELLRPREQDLFR